eukprot:CAMPEP_0173447692 /NCGR_PEP_ID=MMETSP1357-20121228/39178_1 /TAXON_ID=77926 /ORGANISM="Hemiselmis rufescens, Strain PCC563" /LENGTH=43 /DNA_ID= /DNA_START= /DNA_END= /DNA_ORIENTATION=
MKRACRSLGKRRVRASIAALAASSSVMLAAVRWFIEADVSSTT